MKAGKANAARKTTLWRKLILLGLAYAWSACLRPAFEAEASAIGGITYLERISTGGMASGIALSPDNGKLYVAYWEDENASRVQEFDLPSLDLLQTFTFGNYHTHGDVVVSEDGTRIFTTNYYYASVSQIDLANGNARTDLSTVDTWPGDISITPDRTKVIVQAGRDGRNYDMGNDSIAIYDIANDNFALLASVELVDEPQGVGTTQDSQFAYVATFKRQSSTPRLYEISLVEPYQITRTMDFPDTPERLSSAVVLGNTVFVSDPANSKAWAVNRSSWTKTGFAMDGVPGKLAAHPNGAYLFALMPDTGSVVALDVSSMTIVARYDGLSSEARDIEFNSDGTRMYIVHRSPVGEIMVFAVDLFENACGTPLLAVGDQAGNVTVQTTSSETVASVNLGGAAVVRLDAVDLDGDGSLELLATHDQAVERSTTAFDFPGLTSRWETDHPTSFNGSGHELFGRKIWPGDFDDDGDLELVIPYRFASGKSRFQVFSAEDGRRECILDEDRDDTTSFVYRDPVDSTWRLLSENNPTAFTHTLYVNDLLDCPMENWCSNAAVNTWKLGGVAQSMIDGAPRMWGAWYGRTLYVVDRECNLMWSKSFGGSYEAEAVYAGDLRGDDVETILVGGTYGTNHVRLDAARLADGATVWTFDDTDAHWALHVMASRDINSDGAKEVFFVSSGNEDHPPKYQCVSGIDGSRVWQRPYPFGTWMLDHARFVDITGDGMDELLVIANDTVEALNPEDGSLITTLSYDANVTALEVVCSGTAALPDLEFRCVVRDVLSESDQVTELPPASDGVLVDRPFYIEFWATDGGNTNTGIVSAYADVAYQEELLVCDGVGYGDLFDLFGDGVCEASVVDELGASQLSPGVGVQPEWTRVAYAEFTPVATGLAEFRLEPGNAESSAFGRGTILPPDISYGSCTVLIGCPCVYDLDGNCNVAAGDLGLFAPCWECSEDELCWLEHGCAKKDFDCNAAVSGGDLSWFAVGWNRSCGDIDPIADFAPCQVCDGEVYCAEAADRNRHADRPADHNLATKGSPVQPTVLLSLRLRNAQGEPLTAARSHHQPTNVNAGEHVFVDVWARDLSPTTAGLTAVFTDVFYDPTRFAFAAVDSGETFTLFTNPIAVPAEGVVRNVGGGTLEAGQGAGAWVQVASVEFNALVDVAHPDMSLRPSAGEAVSRYGEGLVPTEQVRVVPTSVKRSLVNR